MVPANNMMATRRRRCLSAALLALLLVGASCDKSDEPKPLTNQVYFSEKLEAYGGQTFAVPISFDNEDELSAINVPLLFPSHIMRFDSISFRGSRVNGFGLKVAYLLGDTILIGALGVANDTVTVNKGRGLLTTLYFWMHGNAPETTFVFTTCDSWKQPLSFFDAHFQRLPTPEFVAGRVHVTGITWPSSLEPGESRVPKREHTAGVPARPE